MHVGAEDPAIPATDVEAIRTAARDARLDLDLNVYRGAGHVFACHARPALVQQEAADTTWAKALAFIAATGAAARADGTDARKDETWPT